MTKSSQIGGTVLGDHLASYFKELAEHDLLTADDERSLAQAIESAEVTTWERILACTPNVKPLAEQFEFLAKPKLLKEAKLGPSKKYTRYVKAFAKKLREDDLDRINIDAVVGELRNARKAALKNEKTWWVEGASKKAGTYLDSICQVHRQGSNLRDQFVRANLRLVVTMARRYDRGGMSLPDLIQEGNLGLMHAVSRFDHRRGLRFSTYACWWIRHAIGRALADKARAVRIPVHMLEAQQHIEKTRQILLGELGRPPTLHELSKATKIPVSKLSQNYKYIMGTPVSLDRPLHDDDNRNLVDTLTDPETEETTPIDTLTLEALTKQVKRLIHHLTPMEADVLTKRFGLGDDEEKTFREIGDEYNLSRERIRQVQNSALDKLKLAIEREHKGKVDF